MQTEDGRVATRRRRASAAGSVLVALVAVVAVAVVLRQVTTDGRPHSEPGDLVGVSLSGRGLAGYVSEVVVPDRRLTVVVTEPTTDPTALPDDDADDVDAEPEPLAVQPPEDGSFVGVEVTATDLASAPGGAEPVLPGVDRLPAELTLVVGGAESGERRYPLPDVVRGDVLRTWVAVDGEPSLADVTIDVSYDQVIQVVAPARGSVDHGLAEALYDVPGRAVGTSCGRARLGDDLRAGSSAGCSVTVQRSAYLPGEGWSDSGSWLVVTVAPDPPLVLERPDDPDSRYLVDDDGSAGTTSVLLDGTEPDVVTDTELGDDGPVVVAWDLEEDPTGSRLETRVDLPVSSAAGDPRAIDDVRVEWRRSVPTTD